MSKKVEQHRNDFKQRTAALSYSTGYDNVGWTNLQAALVLAVGIAYCLGVIYEWGPLNGVGGLTHWQWKWRNLGVIKTGVILFVPFACIGWVLWKLEKPVSPARAWVWLSLLALSNFALQVLGMLADPRGFPLIGKIVASRTATSYFSEALKIQNILEWMSQFHQSDLYLHAATHPPGPILFYYFFLKVFGPSTGAMLGGCVVGLAGSAGVLVMYQFAGLWTQERRTRLLASTFYALLPAIVVQFPEFDQGYPIFAMLMILFWVRTLSGAPRYAGYLGAILAVVVFFAYNLLVVGAFLALYGLYFLWREGGSPRSWGILLRSSGIALGVCVGLHLILWAGTGYLPISSFGHASANQARMALNLNRPYGVFVMLDPYDFLLGSGIIALPIIIIHLMRLRKRFAANQSEVVLTLIGLATILIVDFSGLLRGETSRVWLFLQPLLVVPVALELSRLRWSWCLAVLTLQWWIVVCLKAKMSFINP